MHTTGTSGDTGSAAIEAVRSKRWIDIIVLYPKVKIYINVTEGLKSHIFILIYSNLLLGHINVNYSSNVSGKVY